MIPKFRAWDKKYKMMMKVNKINFEENTAWLEADNGDHESRHTLTRELKDILLMQSTGLHDKNGVEIYEGDIVRWFSTVLEKSEWTGTVIRDGAEMCIQTSKISRTSGGMLNVLARDEAIKVIGNVYEQPELLEEEK